MHKPVLYQEVLHALNVTPGSVYLDGTFGRGGHAEGILDALAGQGCLLACDRDIQAIAAAKNNPKFSNSSCHVFHTLLMSTSVLSHGYFANSMGFF